MADSTIKPDSGNDLVLQNNGGTKKIEITDSGNIEVTGDVSFTNDVSFGDNDKAQFGAGNDLQIYHDGSDSYVDDAGTGRLYLRGNDRVQIQKYTGEDMLTCTVDDGVKLYHDNSKKFETTSTGVEVTGNVKISASGGINFSAYATSGNPSSNLLNDYEEGTFEVTIDGGYTGTGINSVDNDCTYIKIGNVVHCHIAFILNGSGSGNSNDVLIGGLPFNTLSQSAGLRNNNFSGQFNAYLTATPGLGDKAYFYVSTKYSSDQLLPYYFSGTTVDALTGTELGTGAVVKIDLTYFVSDFT